MNKFELVIKLITDANQAGTLKDDIKFYFDLAEQIEKEALTRRYIHKVVCDDCGFKIDTIEMDGQTRVRCDCKNGIGKNYDEAYMDWLNK